MALRKTSIHQSFKNTQYPEPPEKEERPNLLLRRNFEFIRIKMIIEYFSRCRFWMAFHGSIYLKLCVSAHLPSDCTHPMENKERFDGSFFNSGTIF